MTDKSNNTTESVSDNTSNEKQWFILHAYSNCEDKVIRSLNERIEHSRLQEKFGDIIVPSEEVVEMYRGKKRKVRRKNYPGYVLINLLLDDETWYLVRNTPNVLGFVGGTAGKPVAISNEEADNILQRGKEAEGSTTASPRHKIVYENGEVVRIKEGPFADFDGVVEQVNYEKSRLRVSVVIFGRATPVELEFSQVEKV